MGLKPALAIFSLALASQFALAAVSSEEAAKLKSEFTPFGAEKAGNREGTIPAWDGGYTTVWPGYQSGQPRPDPFASEKPLFQVTAKNVDQYADKLSDGMKALLKRLPTFRVDVYPTHRTAAAPQWVYDNTFQNATRAKTAPDGLAVENVYGGIPFPIPKTGAEVMLNSQFAWRGEAWGYDFSSYIVTGGKPVMVTQATFDFQLPYYYRDGSLDSFNGVLAYSKLTTTGPPLRAGESTLIYDPANYFKEDRKAWQYLPGQRRVRRTVNLSYDTPNFVTSGFTLFDEGFLFNGALDRYDWKLLGKKEMFVPYNAHEFHAKKLNQVLGPQHINPDSVRWELHRVWVVEATLAAGKRHAIPKRHIYLDEDTWLAILTEGWDANNQLWHVGHAFPVIVPEMPAVLVIPSVTYDLVKRGYVATSLFNERDRHVQVKSRSPQSDFSPAALAGEGVR